MNKTEAKKLWMKEMKGVTKEVFEKVRWCLAYRQSHQFYDYSNKDFARMVLNGLGPMPNTKTGLFEDAWQNEVECTDDEDASFGVLLRIIQEAKTEAGINQELY